MVLFEMLCSSWGDFVDFVDFRQGTIGYCYYGWFVCSWYVGDCEDLILKGKLESLKEGGGEISVGELACFN